MMLKCVGGVADGIVMPVRPDQKTLTVAKTNPLIRVEDGLETELVKFETFVYERVDHQFAEGVVRYLRPRGWTEYDVFKHLVSKI